MSIKKVLFNLKLKLATPTNRAKLIRDNSEVKIGENCEVFDNVSFGSEPYLIDIGNNVRISKNVIFTTHDGGFWVLRNMGFGSDIDKFGKIKIGNNVHIGMNTFILPGICIGDNVVIGAGAVVTKDIPSNSVVAGVPARVIQSVEAYYKKNMENLDYTKDLNREEKKQYLKKKYNL